MQIRPMLESDLAFGNRLRALVGWNQTSQDWKRFWSYQPSGCFIAESNGQPVGTATTTSYGTEVAWIGMVIVHPDYRRRGIATALLRRCLDYLEPVQAVKLDATPLGKAVYEQLGFVEDWSLTRWERPVAAPPAAYDLVEPGQGQVREWVASDRPEVVALDRRAFGVDRARLLNLLLDDSKTVLVTSSPESGQLTGFVALRAGSRADYLGPAVSVDDAMASQLIGRAIPAAGQRLLYWDIPDQSDRAVELAQKFGFIRQRPLLRMHRGMNRWPENTSIYYGIADPAVG